MAKKDIKKLDPTETKEVRGGKPMKGGNFGI